VLHALVTKHPLGTLVRMGAHGLEADHLPFELAAPTDEFPFGLLRAHVARANPCGVVMARHEGPGGWAVADAPREYVDNMVAATVGIEIAIERIEGKWKASQNRSAAERERIVAATYSKTTK